ncbi:hypothetical protein Verru16b_02275 [Lacunisphaera limnophila]|uniref:Chloroplast import component protein (Tic20) n=1 Tax=Lacunisphaera limnophila TaxID=1838286 RepID=A0A1D8AWD7_9BACT|nr:hypothetical protein [Lacunisphaera limnophila]AOS45197.1 hypothetical protein Verru16b_02275 [Lacunisphaera limnophila]
MSTSDTPPVVGTSEERTVAILSYITIIGFIVAIVMHSSKKTKLGAYHLRQMLGLILTGLVGGVVGVIPFIGWVALPLIWIGLLVLWVMGLLAAVNGQVKPVPVLGEQYQKWFGNAFE